MALMQRLRDKTHLILWGLLILFLASMTIGGLVGGADLLEIFSEKARLKDAVGIVNGKKLETSRFSQMIQNEIEQYRQNNQELSEIEIEQLTEQIWQSFINETLLNEKINALGLKATDNEIYQVLLNNPPQFLVQNEAFQIDGNFDYNKYLSALKNPQGNEWVGVEEYLRGYLPFEKMRNLVENLPVIAEAEIREEFVTSKTVCDFETMVIPYSLVMNDTFPVNDTEVNKYYKANKDKFHIPETRELEFVLFSTRPTPADTQSAYQQINNLRDRLLAGESFENLANEYTEDPGGGKNGGDLGWFGRGQMVPEFERTAFTLGKGQLSKPVLTQYGYHLIKVEDKRTQDNQPQVKARHILIKIKTGPETIESVRSQANLFAFDANEYGFAAAADSHQVRIQKTGPFREQDRYLSSLGSMPAAIRFAYGKKPVGTLSEIISNDNGFMIFRLSAVNPESYRPIQEISDQIKNTILNEKRTAQLAVIADEIYQTAVRDSQFATASSKYATLQVEKYSAHPVNTPLNNFGRSNEVIGNLLALRKNEISRPIKAGNRFVIIKLLNRVEPSPEQYKEEQPAIRERLLTRKKGNIYNELVTELKSKARIVDNRSSFY